MQTLLIFFTELQYSREFETELFWFLPVKVNDVILAYLLLTLTKFYTFSGVSIVDSEPVNTDWV